MEKEAQRILTNIEEIRKNLGIKQSVIADILGVNQSAYSNYIRRNKDITYSRLSRICDALEVRVIDVITYPEIYAPEKSSCISCKTKDETIKNLNELIDNLRNQLNQLKLKR
jgi:transcriptional regulator with XRE-family HTH domain